MNVSLVPCATISLQAKGCGCLARCPGNGGAHGPDSIELEHFQFSVGSRLVKPDLSLTIERRIFRKGFAAGGAEVHARCTV